MHTSVQSVSRPTRPGRLLAVGAALTWTGIALEWVTTPQQGDAGTVVDRPVFVLVVGTSLVGCVLLVQGLRSLELPRSRGRVTSLVGASLVAVGVAAVLVTGLVRGAPAPLSFIPWVLGMLVLAIGLLVLGVRMRRSPAGLLLLVSGTAALAALAIGVDPWHDIALSVHLAALAGTGLTLRR